MKRETNIKQVTKNPITLMGSRATEGKSQGDKGT